MKTYKRELKGRCKYYANEALRLSLRVKKMRKIADACANDTHPIEEIKQEIFFLEDECRENMEKALIHKRIISRMSKVEDGTDEYHIFFVDERNIDSSFESDLKKIGYKYSLKHFSWQNKILEKGRLITKMIFTTRKNNSLLKY